MNDWNFLWNDQWFRYNFWFRYKSLSIDNITVSGTLEVNQNENSTQGAIVGTLSITDGTVNTVFYDFSYTKDTSTGSYSFMGTITVDGTSFDASNFSNDEKFFPNAS